MLRALGISVFFFAFCSLAGAESVHSTFPVARFYPDPVGLLYPGFNVAAGVNPAALPAAGKGTALQAGFSPAPAGAESQIFGAVAHSNTRFGIGAGYQGDMHASGTVHNAFVGMGASFQNLSVGFALRDYGLSSGITPSVDAGLNITLKMVDVGFVFYGLDSHPRMGIGIGSRQSRRFALEGNVLLPPFSAFTGGYLLTVSAQLAVEKVTAYFRTSYDTAAQALSHTLGLGWWASENLHLAIQYSTPSRIGTAVTVAL